MLLKFFNRGTGKGSSCVNYLISSKDSKGIERVDPPEVLRGEPKQTIELIDCLDFKHKYCSGVISFAPEDAPTPQQQESMIDSFEEVAFAGLDSDSYSILWVRHTHTSGGRVELHFVTPRVELTTGKSLNIAPPGWGNYFRPWRDYWNSSQEWASPDDPARARGYHPDYHALIDAQNKRLELAEQPTTTRDDYRKVITSYLGEGIKEGRIKDREDIVNCLKESGFEINRMSEDYLTVFREDLKKKVRLKGAIYRKNWRVGKGYKAQAGSQQKIDKQKKVSEAEEEIRNRVLERTNYHQKRYGKTEIVSVDEKNYEPLNQFLVRQLGDDAIISQTSPREKIHSTVQSRPEQPEMKRQTTSKGVREEELERFKTDIDLVEYALSEGYALDKNKSSQNCIVLKGTQGDKILVGVDQTDQHYFYSSITDNNDSGSIIDFVQKRKNLNLGEVRQELRPYIGRSSAPTYTFKEPTLKPITKDRHLILAQFENMEARVNHPYLNQRGITQETISYPRFKDKIYSDSKGNVIFPHRDREGICGYEIRSQQFKGFSEGGTKGLWDSLGSQDDNKLVVCESPIDCLSYYQLFPDSQTRYFATGGTVSEKQKDLLKGAFEKIHANGGQIIVATDNDEAGQKLASEISKNAPQGCQIYRHLPKQQKDWNELLKAEIIQERQECSQSRRRSGMDLEL